MRYVFVAVLSAAIAVAAYARENPQLDSPGSLSPDRNISCNFSEAPLPEVLAFFREQGMNVVCDLPAAQQQDTQVTLELKDVPAQRALDAVLRQVGLEKTRDGNVLYVTRPQRVRRYETRRLRQYPVHDLVVPLPAPQRSGNGNDNNNENDNEEEEDVARRSSREVMAMIILFTGARNWDYVGQIGRDSGEGNGNNGYRR